MLTPGLFAFLPGERSATGLRDGRGVGVWPDPPKGGGEQYLGLWRDDHPCESGVFCWYSGEQSTSPKPNSRNRPPCANCTL
eukprot:2620209-Rhodomonas_salina.5